MIQFHKLIALLILLPTLSGCEAFGAHIMTRDVSSNLTGRSLDDPARVKVYASEKEVTDPYVAVARLSSETGHCFGSREELILALQGKAADLGANGIVLIQVNQSNINKSLCFSGEALALRVVVKMVPMTYFE